jgi:hypothetical protein
MLMALVEHAYRTIEPSPMLSNAAGVEDSNLEEQVPTTDTQRQEQLDHSLVVLTGFFRPDPPGTAIDACEDTNKLVQLAELLPLLY